MNARQYDQAEQILRRHLQKEPKDATGLHILAATLLSKEQPAQAAFFADQANHLFPHDFAILSVLGTALAASGNAKRAVDAYQEATTLAPDKPTLWSGLGVSLMSLDQLDEAIRALDHALSLNPSDLPAIMNLAICHTRLGDALAALRVARSGLERFPNNHALLLHAASMSNYADTMTPSEVRALHDTLARATESTLPTIRPLPATPLADRPLKVALLSGDFFTHSCSFFLEPLMTHLADPAARDSLKLELACYSATHKHDDTTKRLRSLGHPWRDITKLSDQACADAIRSDKIDILIDCAGYTHDSRVQVLAHRAAPLQMTYLGYPNTTALKQCDYRIVDSITDPHGSEHLCSETLIRLDPHFLCYTPLRNDRNAPINPIPPQERTARITFASFNATLKIVDSTIRAWAEILKAVPNSRLLLKAKHESARNRFAASFASHGIDPARIELLPPVDSTLQHMALYNDVDVALDPFPYNGTTTSYEAIAMGVPVVALLGDRHAARVSASILTTLGLPELIASSEANYISLAASLSTDPARLRTWRSELRNRLLNSIACDPAAFTTRFAKALHAAWEERLATQSRA